MTWEAPGFDVHPLRGGDAWMVVDRGSGERAFVRRLRPQPPPPRPRRRPPVAALALALLAVAAVALVSVDHPGGPSPRPRPAVAAPDWRAVVGGLERQRLAALGRRDAARLQRLYAPGTAGLAADLATVGRLRAGGLHAVGAAARVDSARVVSAGPDRVVLDVVDALGGYLLVDAAGRVAHRVPPRPPRRERLVLARVEGAWRLAAVSPGPAAA